MVVVFRQFQLTITIDEVFFVFSFEVKDDIGRQVRLGITWVKALYSGAKVELIRSH